MLSEETSVERCSCGAGSAAPAALGAAWVWGRVAGTEVIPWEKALSLQCLNMRVPAELCLSSGNKPDSPHVRDSRSHAVTRAVLACEPPRGTVPESCSMLGAATPQP